MMTAGFESGVIGVEVVFLVTVFVFFPCDAMSRTIKKTGESGQEKRSHFGSAAHRLFSLDDEECSAFDGGTNRESAGRRQA